ncbi:hypothetical protein OA101_01580 [Alphaproteobacteria bacterium]|jgi:hypothetical protein|nr:hypothetical protein [Alphaproteobacteria bacterium]
MLLHSMISTPIPGKMDNFNKFLMMNLELAGECGVATSVKVSSSGTAGIEIMANNMFADWQDYGDKTQAMRAHPKFKAIMDFGADNEVANWVDSYMADLLPGFETDAKLSEGPILATVWKPIAGRAGDMIKVFHESKGIHEPHGCMVRSFQVIGGRYSGCYLYNMSFEDNAALGKCMNGIQEEHRALAARFGANPPAEMVAQLKMDNPVLVG